MSQKLTGLQRLLLWHLAFLEDGVHWKDIPFSITAAQRKKLERAGLIEVRSRKNSESGRQAMHIQLDDGGWAWCNDHLAHSIGTRSPSAIPVLENVLRHLGQFLSGNEDVPTLGQFVLEARTVPDTATATDFPGLQAKVLAACEDLGGGDRMVRIRLSDLRDKMEVEPHVLDKLLLRLEADGVVSLMPLDDPREIKARDRKAVLTTPAGAERHILYVKEAT